MILFAFSVQAKRNNSGNSLPPFETFPPLAVWPWIISSNISRNIIVDGISRLLPHFLMDREFRQPAWNVVLNVYTSSLQTWKFTIADAPFLIYFFFYYYQLRSKYRWIVLENMGVIQSELYLSLLILYRNISFMIAFKSIELHFN